MEKEILVAKEVGEMIRASEQRVYQMCREGLIPYILLGQRQYRFSRKAIEKWLNKGGNKNSNSNCTEQQEN